jgi:hypothetical protein
MTVRTDRSDSCRLPLRVRVRRGWVARTVSPVSGEGAGPRRNVEPPRQDPHPPSRLFIMTSDSWTSDYLVAYDPYMAAEDVPVAELRQHLRSGMDKVQRGESFTVSRSGVPIATIALPEEDTSDRDD